MPSSARLDLEPPPTPPTPTTSTTAPLPGRARAWREPGRDLLPDDHGGGDPTGHDPADSGPGTLVDGETGQGDTDQPDRPDQPDQPGEAEEEAELPAPDGQALLDRVYAELSRYVVLPTSHAQVAVTLWIAATHAQTAWAHAPRLVIRGPDKRCGKSRLLDVVEALVFRPLLTVNSSVAAVYRSISEDPPTILVDEADTIFGPKAGGSEDLRGLLNAGHQANRPARRLDRGEPRDFPTFAMAALAGIGAMPDTIEDRAVVVRMRRRAPEETVAPYRHKRDRPALAALGSELNEWLRQDTAVLEKWVPELPVEDRTADTWEPLAVVAEYAGGPWPQLARDAVLALTAEGDDGEEGSDRTRLLRDIRTAFGDLPAMRTATLIQTLRADPEAPWAELSGSGLTPRRLAMLLEEYGIHSANIRLPDGQAKGYKREQFADAWHRYLRPTPPPPDPDPGELPPPTPVDLDGPDRYPAAPGADPDNGAGPDPASDLTSGVDGTAGRDGTPPHAHPGDDTAPPADRPRPAVPSRRPRARRPRARDPRTG